MWDNNHNHSLHKSPENEEILVFDEQQTPQKENNNRSARVLQILPTQSSNDIMFGKSSKKLIQKDTKVSQSWKNKYMVHKSYSVNY